MIPFADAVDFAYEALAELDSLPDEADKLAVFIVIYCDNGDDASLQMVIDAARTQALSFDALSRAGAIMVRRGGAIPPLLREWLGQHLSGEIKRPKISSRFKTGWPGATLERDLILHDLVTTFADFGLTATRNDASAPVSGCDAVAEAMARRKLRPQSYKDIKKIHAELRSC